MKARTRWMLGTVTVCLLVGLVWFAKGARRVHATEPGVPAGTVSLRACLASYWGPRWGEIEKQLAHGDPSTQGPIDMEIQVPPLDPSSWDEAALRIQDDFLVLSESEIDSQRSIAKKWPTARTTKDVDFSDRHYNPKGKTLSDADRARLIELAAEFDSQLDDLAISSADALIHYTTKLWKEERYSRNPYVPLQPPNPFHRKVMITRSYDLGVWKVSYSVFEGDDATFDSAIAAESEVRQARMLAVMNYIATLP